MKWRTCICALAKELGLPDDAQSAAAFQRDVLEWPAFEDSVAALKRLRKHYRLVAMTNADRVALSAYAHTLGDPFDDTVCCDETGVAKPDPQFFAYNRGRQAAFGFKFGEILHTAQSQYHDIGIATKLGYATCWIERRQGLKGFGATPVPEAVTDADVQVRDARRARGRRRSRSARGLNACSRRRHLRAAARFALAGDGRPRARNGAPVSTGAPLDAI